MALTRRACAAACLLAVGCGARRSPPSDATARVPVSGDAGASAAMTLRSGKNAGSELENQGPAAPPADATRALAVDTLAEGPRVAHLTARRVDQGYLLAWVTYVDGFARPAPGGAARDARKATKPGAPMGAAPGATVMVRTLDPRGDLTRAPTSVSLRAEPVGGVELAASPFDPQEIGLAWVGQDEGVSQVFLTRLSASGEKLGQRMITRGKGGCSDVALATGSGAFVLAWLDEREGRPAIYAAKVGRNLERVGLERKIADVRGEASGLRIVIFDNDIVLAWREAREGEGTSGIFAARLAPTDLSPRALPARILGTSSLAASLEVVKSDDGLWFGWVEPRGTGNAAVESRRGVVLARLDAALRPRQGPLFVAGLADASSLSLDCAGSEGAGGLCHAVVAGSEHDQLSISGFAFRSGEAPAPAAHLAYGEGASTEDISPVLLGDRLFFAEDDLHGGGRVRAAIISWR